MTTIGVNLTIRAAPAVAVTVGTVGQIDVAVSSVGPQGPPGDSTITAEAAEALGGHRAVAWRSDRTIELADNTTSAHRWATVGVTTGAASLGAEASIQAGGLLVEPSWSWTPLGLIYLGTAGALTQTPPTAPAFLRVLGHAIDATSMWVDVQQPIIQT